MLYFLSWSGFMASFMMRNDINLAIVSMVRQPTNVTVNTSIALNESDNEVPNVTTFDWSSTVQSMIMGSFYACYVLSQVSHGISDESSSLSIANHCDYYHFHECVIH